MEDNTGKKRHIDLTPRDMLLLAIFFIIFILLVFAVGIMVGSRVPERLSGPPQAEAAAGGSAQTAKELPQQRTPSSAGQDPIQERDLAPVTAGPSGTESTSPESSPSGTEAGANPPATGAGKTAEAALPDSAQHPGTPLTPPPPETGHSESPPPKKQTEGVQQQAEESSPVKPSKPAPPPAAPTEKPAPPPAVSPDQPYFVIQTIATEKVDEARQMVEKLKSAGYRAFLVSPDAVARDNLYRVQLGPFPTLEAARLTLDKLKQAGYRDAFPLRIKPTPPSGE